MIKSLTLANYKCFADDSKLELRPITLLFGYNNTGKSALLRALVLLSASLRGKPGAPISLDHEAARGCLFQDLTGELAFKTRRGFEFCFEFEDSVVKSATWAINEFPDLKKQVVVHFGIEFQQFSCDAYWMPSGSPRSDFKEPYYVVDGSNAHVRELHTNADSNAHLEFSGLLPEGLSHGNTPYDQLLEVALKDLKGLGMDVKWLGPRRVHGERSLVFRGITPISIDPDGGGALDILATEAAQSGGELGILGTNVSAWFERYLGRRLRINWQSERYNLVLEPTQKTKELESQYGVNLADSGEGLMQVLPLLVSLSMLKRGDRYDPTILALEEPESHLHPRLHTALAESILETIREGRNSKVVVETHSEIILLRIQRAIAEGLDHNKVIVYWIRQIDSGKTVLEPVEFDELGRPNGNMPPTIFAEDSRQAKLLLDSQRAGLSKSPQSNS